MDKDILYIKKGPYLISGNKIDLRKYLKNDLLIINIDSESCMTKNDLFNEFAKKLSFPKYFGYNWDAFQDIMSDLDWLSPNKYKGIVILISNSFSLLNGFSDEMNIFKDIIDNVGKNWNTGDFDRIPIAFHVILL